MTNEAKPILEDMISDFAPEKFIHFFRAKSRQFKEIKENLAAYHDDDFAKGQKLGEIKFSDGDTLVVCAFAAQKPLTERSGKKAQYDKAKKILKDHRDYYAAAIFIFYDAEGNFRFSLVYPEYTADKKIWPNFRRFTYFVSTDPVVTNKTFKQRIGDGDFSTLEKVKEAFSVEKVTREFYEAIANWYFWAVQYCRFPKEAEAEENGRNISVIRLITRMIFIWFMRERGLVPKAIFDAKKMKNILKDTSPEDSTYYKAILQNLFFATLSTRKEERQFRSEVRGHKGYNPDFGNQYVYRYHDLFKNPDDIKAYFGNVPFLNGGLFECLDDKPNGIYIDGFTSVKKNQPEMPNFLFFGDEKTADLNSIYGTTNKKYNVRGLLNILSSFSFTIDENSMDDQEVALDPELLGRVFENLLASFNPETATTARKATGSYYTPRGIVDYMVTESLKAYFKTHLLTGEHSYQSEESIDSKLAALFSTSDEQNPFSPQETTEIVDLLESVKIVDPAVGSGAFPMGALHKMVFILNRLDPGNELWKQAQIKAAAAITDPALRRETKKKIEEFFRGKNADYGRKLYLIQRCIYGVDIQQIAVEIAKLRFFIALLVDEKIEPEKDNWGIEPLPNLDFKIMQGNSLISSFMGVDFDAAEANDGKQVQSGFDFADAEDNLIKTFEQTKIDFQNEAEARRKNELKADVENLLIALFEQRVKKQRSDYFKALEDIERKNAVMPVKTRAELIAQEKQKLARKSGFDLDAIEKQLREFTSKKKVKPFFPWRLYFAEVFEKGGFDITIGNPPYVRADEKSEWNRCQREQILASKNYETLWEKWDLFVPFIEKSFKLLVPGGVTTLIVSDAFCHSKYAQKAQIWFLKNAKIIRLDFCSNLQIFDAAVHNLVFFFQKNDGTHNTPERRVHYNEFGNAKLLPSDVQSNLTYRAFFPDDKVKGKFVCQTLELDSICYISKGMVVNSDEKRAQGAFQMHNLVSDVKDNRHPKRFAEGKHLDIWLPLSHKWLEWGTARAPKLYSRPTFPELHESYEKILVQRSPGPDPKCCYDNQQIHFTESSVGFIPWHMLAGVRNNSLKKYARYRDERPPRPDLPKREDLEASSCRFSVKYLLGVMNSDVARDFLRANRRSNIHLYPDDWKKLPIPDIDSVAQQPIINLVDRILDIKKGDHSADVSLEEQDINRLVCALYNLDPIIIVSSETG